MIYTTISRLLLSGEWTKHRKIPRVEVVNANPMVDELAKFIPAYLPKKVVKSGPNGQFS